VNRVHLCRGGLASSTILAATLVACGGSRGANNPDGGSSDATASPPGDSAATDTAQGSDGTQDADIDADSGGSAPDKDAEAGAIIGDSGDSGGASLDAGDAAATSACEGGAAFPPDASLPPVHICSFRDGGAAFPFFTKCCAATEDCTIGVYQNSCCGDTFALGLNRSQVTAFGQTVADWSCAACGCAGTGLHTEDGKPGVTDAGVRCDHGWCMSYAN